MLNQTIASPQKIIRNVPLIMVVDDNEDNILFACGSLELLKFNHLTADNAKDALDLAMDKLPDLILLDIVMPETDGISITRYLKRNCLTNHIPIIAVTGLAFSAQRKQIMNSGCDDYLCKPFLIEHLQAKIARFMAFSGTEVC